MAMIDNDYLAWRESLLYRVPQVLENHVWMGLCKEAFTAGKAAGRKAAAPAASGGEDSAAVIREALQRVIDAVGAYLPPDGITRDDLISRVIEATDNPEIVRAMK